MDIIDRYHEKICDIYMRTHKNASREQVINIIEQITNENLRNIPCVIDNNVTHVKMETDIINVINWIESSKPIITATGSFFKQHAEYRSPTVKMLEKLQKSRKAKKKEMYKCEKGSIAYTNLNVGQGAIKVIMNADYGGSGTPLSPFYSLYIPPATTGSAKNITTTLICCLELLTGNTETQWMKIHGINALFDFIFIVLDNDEEREIIDALFTPEQVYNRLLSISYDLTTEDADVLKSFVYSLTDQELTKLMFAFNIHLVLQKYLSVDVKATADYYLSHKLNIEKVSKIKDKKEAEHEIYLSGFGVKRPVEIEHNIERICKVVCDNCVYPYMPDDPEVRATYGKRKIVCVTDTDSLMVHFAHYIDSFQVRVPNFKDSCIFAGGLGMRLFIETIIPKFVVYIGLNFGVEDEYFRKKLEFKNEFFYAAMLLFAKKMYAGALLVQEGNPRNPHVLDVKGLSFKKRDAAEFLEDIMLNMYDQYVLNSPVLQVDKIVDDYFTLRNKLKDEIRISPSYYKILGVKDKDYYKPTLDENGNVVKEATIPASLRGSMVWNSLMPEEEILPLDRVIVIPLSFKLLHEHANGDNVRVSQILDLCRIDNENEKLDPYICLPEKYKSRTIPEWIRPVIDDDYAIDKILAPWKQILGGLRVNLPETRGGTCGSRMMII